MNSQAYQRDGERQRVSLFVAALFMAAALAGPSESLASCGDYLVHDWPSSNAMAAANDADGARDRSLDDRRNNATPIDPTEPVSACAGGRCQSLPMWPPSQHPSRMVFWRQAVTLSADSELQSSDDTVRWGHPANGLLPHQPCLTIDDPPPRCAFLQA